MAGSNTGGTTGGATMGVGGGSAGGQAAGKPTGGTGEFRAGDTKMTITRLAYLSNQEPPSELVMVGRALYRWIDGGYQPVQPKSIHQFTGYQLYDEATGATLALDRAASENLYRNAPTIVERLPPIAALGDLLLLSENNRVYEWTGFNWTSIGLGTDGTLDTLIYDPAQMEQTVTQRENA